MPEARFENKNELRVSSGVLYDLGAAPPRLFYNAPAFEKYRVYMQYVVIIVGVKRVVDAVGLERGRLVLHGLADARLLYFFITFKIKTNLQILSSFKYFINLPHYCSTHAEACQT